MSKKKKYLKISEVSKLYNIGIDSLRYYEEIGLIEPYRGENGYRYYGMRELMLLNIMREYRILNFSLAEIRDMFENRSLDTMVDLLNRGMLKIDDQIRELNQRKVLIQERIDSISMFRTNMPYGRVFIKQMPEFKCLHVAYDDIHPQDIDLHINKYLLNSDTLLDDLIGRYDGYRLDMDSLSDSGDYRVREVLIINNAMRTEPDMVIPGGEYLIYNSDKEFPSNRPMVDALKEYITEKGIETEGDYYEISVFDLYDTDVESEYLTSVMVKIKQP